MLVPAAYHFSLQKGHHWAKNGVALGNVVGSGLAICDLVGHEDVFEKLV